MDYERKSFRSIPNGKTGIEQAGEPTACRTTEHIIDEFSTNTVARRYVAMGRATVEHFKLGDKLGLNSEEKKYINHLAALKILQEQRRRMEELKRDLVTGSQTLSQKGSFRPLLSAPLSSWVDLKVNSYSHDFLKRSDDVSGFKGYWNNWLLLPESFSRLPEKSIVKKLDKVKEAESVFGKYLAQTEEYFVGQGEKERMLVIGSAMNNILAYGLDQGAGASRRITQTQISIPDNKIEIWSTFWKERLGNCKKEEVSSRNSAPERNPTPATVPIMVFEA